MLQDITLGQYFPGNSPLHRLDPRTKILLLPAIMILLFATDDAAAYCAMTAATVALVFASQVSPMTVIKSVKPLMWIILFTLLIHFVSHDGEPLIKIWVFKVTREGVAYGILISLRLILLIILSSLLTFTTSPIKLTDAMEKLLSPFGRVGVPAHELAMMMTIALRFVPTLIEETDKIMKAQKSRGADFETGNLIQRARSMVPILVPLFLSSFRRADELAMAMEARCYRGGTGRTHVKELRFSSADVVATATVAIFGAGVVLLSRMTF